MQKIILVSIKDNDKNNDNDKDKKYVDIWRGKCQLKEFRLYSILFLVNLV